MAYQITLTPDEYAALSAAAIAEGKSIEMLVHEALAERLRTNSMPALIRPMSARDFLDHLYQEGVISNIPTEEPDTPEEATERERLTKGIGPGKPLSEMVIEDRGRASASVLSRHQRNREAVRTL